MSKPSYDEILKVLKTLTFNADMASHFIPHVLLKHAVQDAKAILAKVDEPEEDYDPTPYCSGCGAMTRPQCNCGPIASNE